MATALNLFPARVRFTNADGTLTPEAYRALRILFDRVGGALGDNGSDVFAVFGGGDMDATMGEVSARETLMQPQSSDECCQFPDLSQAVESDVLFPDLAQKPDADLFFPDVVQPANEIGSFAVADAIHSATSKTTPVDADELPLADSAASFSLKKLTWANLKATLAAWIAGGTIPGAFTTLSATENATFSKNLGLGAAPSAWSVSYKALQIGRGSFSQSSGFTLLGNNFYDNGTIRYVETAEASYYAQVTGVHKWFTAPSGTAGNAISFTEKMNLSSDGLAVYGGVTVGTYTTATKPAHAAGKLIYVSDGGAGANFQGSTGSAWVNLG